MGYKYSYWELFMTYEESKIERIKMESDSDEEDTNDDDEVAARLHWWEGLQFVLKSCIGGGLQLCPQKWH